ncbi:hypothetical protein CEXT_783331 [Caerostris extrusa]|uniref:Uncharacterized protein n=1 Tax=Caerostris extrusa TaxID=172846 RepID=A0AAV4QM54_CAEEX|nr:hypothetical protein CEXT_783331 [Caerostris extrusa]
MHISLFLDFNYFRNTIQVMRQTAFSFNTKTNYHKRSLPNFITPKTLPNLISNSVYQSLLREPFLMRRRFQRQSRFDCFIDLSPLTNFQAALEDNNCTGPEV